VGISANCVREQRIFRLKAVMGDTSIYRSHPKKVFSLDIGVESSSQLLDILKYACGLILGVAFRLRLKATPDK
jgi:hypothetical protein